MIWGTEIGKSGECAVWNFSIFVSMGKIFVSNGAGVTGEPSERASGREHTAGSNTASAVSKGWATVERQETKEIMPFFHVKCCGQAKAGLKKTVVIFDDHSLPNRSVE
jgi:hypothetical protein